MTIPKKVLMLIKEGDGDLEIRELRGCCCQGCDQPASIALCWTREEDYYCLDHARGWIKTGWAMAHYLPERTARLLSREEMLFEDPMMSPDTFAQIAPKLKLHEVLWGNSHDTI